MRGDGIEKSIMMELKSPDEVDGRGAGDDGTDTVQTEE